MKLGALVTRHGVPVIFDATAHRRSHREHARRKITRFLEVYVDCPLDVCMKRDPKGLYRKAQQGVVTTVPGLQVPYEAPVDAEITVSGNLESPEQEAKRIVKFLEEHRYLD